MRSLGARDYLTKPIEVGAFLVIIDEAANSATRIPVAAGAN
jgi:hypothetical protein